MKAMLRAVAGRTEKCARIVSTHVCKHVYRNDVAESDAIVRRYWVPAPPGAESTVFPGVRCENGLSRLKDARATPFVYESPDAPHLKRLRDTFDLPKLIAGASTEYDAMLALGAWLGSRWDHGCDPIPGGTPAMDVVHTIRQGMRGQKYWCEVASKVAVQGFAAMGWPARLVSASSDGRRWEHAVLEAWSSEFARWFVIDTDFNVVYEARGVPLSAYELCHDGLALQRQGDLHIRPLGAPKPSLPYTDQLPFFACISLDLRSDWYTRKLKRGSPAGGDLATWWTARPGFARSLAPKVRVDDRDRFNWPVNVAWLRLEDVQAVDGSYAVRARLHAYAPHFAAFQASVDDGNWTTVDGDVLQLGLSPGSHTIHVRIKTSSGGCGMSNAVRLHLS
jgi:hypothetical protein